MLVANAFDRFIVDSHRVKENCGKTVSLIKLNSATIIVMKLRKKEKMRKEIKREQEAVT